MVTGPSGIVSIQRGAMSALARRAPSMFMAMVVAVAPATIAVPLQLATPVNSIGMPVALLEPSPGAPHVMNRQLHSAIKFSVCWLMAGRMGRMVCRANNKNSSGAMGSFESTFLLEPEGLQGRNDGIRQLRWRPRSAACCVAGHAWSVLSRLELLLDHDEQRR